ELFFVISGYIMSGLISDDPARFAHNRAVRIYPSFWAAIVLSIVLQGLFVHVRTPVDLHSIFLISTPNANNYLAIPFWTLTYEVAFYMVCAVFTILRRPDYFWLFIGIWTIAIGAAWWTHLFSGAVATPPERLILLSPIN